MGITTLGKTFKERRKNLGITQPHLAELSGISANTIYMLERGRSNPTLEVLTKIADVLGMELKLQVKNKI